MSRELDLPPPVESEAQAACEGIDAWGDGATEVEGTIVLDADAAREAVLNTLELAGYSWEELKEYAREGRFPTADACWTWHAVAGFAEATLD